MHTVVVKFRSSKCEVLHTSYHILFYSSDTGTNFHYDDVRQGPF